MLLTELLNGVYTTAKIIYEQVEVSEENKERCKELFGRVGRIRLSVEDLLKKSNDLNLYEALIECLQKCLVFLNELSPATIQKNDLGKLLTSTSHSNDTRNHQEKFEELSKKLEKMEGDITLALNIANNGSSSVHRPSVAPLYDPSSSTELNGSTIPTRIPARVTLNDLSTRTQIPQFKKTGINDTPTAVFSANPLLMQFKGVPTTRVPVSVTFRELRLEHETKEKISNKREI